MCTSKELWVVDNLTQSQTDTISGSNNAHINILYLMNFFILNILCFSMKNIFMYTENPTLIAHNIAYNIIAMMILTTATFKSYHMSDMSNSFYNFLFFTGKCFHDLVYFHCFLLRDGPVKEDTDFPIVLHY